MDYFIKWLEVYAIPNQEASTVTKALVNNVFRCFRVSQELHTDQRHNFDSRLIHDVLECLGVSKTRTTPPHLQSDSMVERWIKTVEMHL